MNVPSMTEGRANQKTRTRTALLHTAMEPVREGRRGQLGRLGCRRNDFSERFRSGLPRGAPAKLDVGARSANPNLMTRALPRRGSGRCR
jgi:hypothetical protein